jgi:N-acetylglucosamine-6-phosphate deacetylase
MRLGVKAALIDRTLVQGDVEVVAGQVTGYGLASRGGSGIAAPGFIDLQVNGFAGIDFLHADADGYRIAGEALLETGVTAYLPTFISAPEEHLISALQEIPPSSARAARILGAHMEGPFLSAKRLGTHLVSARQDPDIEMMKRFLATGATIRMVTLAPELPRATTLIRFLRTRGVIVSLGHSDATADEARLAFDEGVSSVTHLFNAMRPFRHRDPGIVGAALARDDVVLGLIVDGVHVAPEAVATVWRAARGRVALVTDATAGARAGDGSYSLGGFTVEVRNRVVRGPTGVLAGSVLTMIDAVRNLHKIGVPLAEALHAASTVPARVLRRQEVSGRIVVGAPAELIVLSDSLDVLRVVIGERDVAVA